MEQLLYQYRMEFNFQSSKRHGTQNQRDLERTVTIPNDDATVITLHNSTQEGGGGNVDVDRHLRTYRSFCTKICAGYARGRCLALKDIDNVLVRTMYPNHPYDPPPHPQQRELFYSSTGCDNQKSRK